MKVTIKLNDEYFKRFDKEAKESLVETADALLSDLKESQTMPFDIGNLQNRSTTIDKSNINQKKVSIVSDTPYARRLYFHPEYNFQQDKNPNAGGEWFEPYIDGEKKHFAKNAFSRIMKGKIDKL